MKTAVASEAKSIQKKNHTSVQSTGKSSRGRGASININRNVIGPGEDRDGIAKVTPFIIIRPRNGGSGRSERRS
jgi:hypothetical protein